MELTNPLCLRCSDAPIHGSEIAGQQPQGKVSEIAVIYPKVAIHRHLRVSALDPLQGASRLLDRENAYGTIGLTSLRQP